jgi:hypothetical protein
VGFACCVSFSTLSKEWAALSMHPSQSSIFQMTGPPEALAVFNSKLQKIGASVHPLGACWAYPWDRLLCLGDTYLNTSSKLL